MARFLIRASTPGGPRQMPRSALSNDESKSARRGRLSRSSDACVCLCSTHPTVIFIGRSTGDQAGVLTLFGKARPTASAGDKAFRAVRNVLCVTHYVRRASTFALDRPLLLVDRGPGKVSVAWLAQHCGPFGFGAHHQDRAWGDNQRASTQARSRTGGSLNRRRHVSSPWHWTEVVFVRRSLVHCLDGKVFDAVMLRTPNSPQTVALQEAEAEASHRFDPDPERAA